MEPAAKKIKVTATATTDHMKKKVIKFRKLTPNAKTPTKGSLNAAGHDLYSAGDSIIPPGDKGVIPTDIQLQLPLNCYGRIAPRSGLALNHGIDTLAGVVDADYRGPISVLLINLGNRPFHVRKGDRIAQIIIERIYHACFVHKSTLTNSERGNSGFGSTGQ